MVSENALTDDIILTGQSVSDSFGDAVVTGDFNSDGIDDFAVGADNYGSSGRVYVFYGGGLTSKNASTADVLFTAESFLNDFGTKLASADINSDDNTDLIVGAT